jgi:hypothetical protein
MSGIGVSAEPFRPKSRHVATARGPIAAFGARSTLKGVWGGGGAQSVLILLCVIGALVASRRRGPAYNHAVRVGGGAHSLALAAAT